MGMIICGLNGTGKSTLGKALAEKLHIHFIDIEDLYFPEADSDDKYAFSRTFEEVKELLLQEMKAHENFVLASVKGEYGEEFFSFLEYVVLLDVPRAIRLQRVRNRSFRKFGNRMLPGGDLHEREERFFDLVRSRAEDTVEEWVKSLECPVIRVDGTKPVEENVNFILKRVKA